MAKELEPIDLALDCEPGNWPEPGLDLETATDKE